ncbi:MAG: pro-sigmaK processing inhibitor BofA family protein [Oscillospiraceae bacterium]
MRYLLIALFAVAFAVVVRAASRQKRPFAGGFFPALAGLTSLACVNALASFTGFAIPINYVTAATSVVLGVPGTVLLLAVRLMTNH